jgi:hypothetical protein
MQTDLNAEARRSAGVARKAASYAAALARTEDNRQVPA